jgi:hypothetical protein
VREAAVDGDIADTDMVSLFPAANAAACQQVKRTTSGPGTVRPPTNPVHEAVLIETL